MDRELPPAEIRRARRRRLGLGLAALAVGVAGYLALGLWLRPTVERRALRLGRVESGAIDSALEAGGTVEPLEERLITSPTEARVLAVLRRAGDRVAPGEPILRLDTSELELEHSKLERQLALQGNERRLARLASQHRLEDLEADLRAQRLQLDYLRARREQTERLHADGLVSQTELLAARLEVDQAQATLDKIEASAANARAEVQAQLAGIDLQIGILEQERSEIERKLRQAAASSEVAGTLTWVLAEPGTMVRPGDVLARLSDLSAFRVRATLSDVHATRIEAGLPARVHVDGEVLQARVGTVLPAVQNGTVSFLVEPEQPSFPGLRASRRVDVEVVVERRAQTLIVPRGPAISGSGPQSLFVVSGDRAERRPVTVGLINLDWCELTSGVRAGDELILSDTRAWASVDELALR